MSCIIEEQHILVFCMIKCYRSLSMVDWLLLLHTITSNNLKCSVLVPKAAASMLYRRKNCLFDFAYPDGAICDRRS